MTTNRSGRLTAVLIIVFCAIAVSSRAGQDRWTSAGPEGGYISGLAIDPSDPARLYASTGGGGIFRTNDAGENWTAVNSGVTSYFVISLTIDRTNPSTLYAGDSSDLLKSVDGGRSWASILKAYVMGVIIDPSNHSNLYARSNFGVFASGDGGATWTQAGNGLPSAPLSMAIDSLKPNQLYAGTLSGLFMSSDRGQQWTPFGGLGDAVTTAVAVDPSDSSRIYVAADQYVAVTTDGGKTWKKSQLMTQVRDFLIVPSQSQTVYAASDDGVFRSSDAGQTWQQLPAARGPVAVDPGNPATLYAGAAGLGVLRSNDGGVTWTAKTSGITAGFTIGIAMDPANPSLIYAGTAGGVFKSDDRGSHWALSNHDLINARTICIDPVTPSTVYAGDVSSAEKTSDGGKTWKEIHPNFNVVNPVVGPSQFVVDPSNTSTVYAALEDSGIFKSTNGGETWMGVDDGLMLGYYGFTAQSLAIDPTNPSALFAGSFGVVKTTNGGAHWTPVSEGLLDTNDTVMTPTALAIDPMDPSIVYAATPRQLFRTIDGGQHWSKSSNGLQSETPTVAGIAIDPLDPSTVYAAVLGTGVFRSEDRGSSWSPFNTGLLSLAVWSIAIDRTGRFLAVGASNGVFTYDIVSRLPVDLQARQLSDDPSRGLRLLERLKSGSARPGFIIVPSGTVSGAHGAHFRSDVTIVNGAATPQEVMLIWLPAGFNGRVERSFQITLPPSATTTVAGFAEKLGFSGLGALLLLAVDANGDIDPGASITGSSRIWTIGPNNPGTVSESVAGVKLDDVISRTSAFADGLRHDQNFRTNIGIVNLDAEPHTFSVDLGGEHYSTSLSIDVAPLSMSQVPVPPGNYGAMHAVFRTSTSFPWTAYGSSIDNKTGEGSLVPAQ